MLTRITPTPMTHREYYAVGHAILHTIPDLFAVAKDAGTMRYRASVLQDAFALRAYYMELVEDYWNPPR